MCEYTAVAEGECCPRCVTDPCLADNLSYDIRQTCKDPVGITRLSGDTWHMPKSPCTTCKCKVGQCKNKPNSSPFLNRNKWFHVYCNGAYFLLMWFIVAWVNICILDRESGNKSVFLGLMDNICNIDTSAYNHLRKMLLFFFFFYVLCHGNLTTEDIMRVSAGFSSDKQRSHYSVLPQTDISTCCWFSEISNRVCCIFKYLFQVFAKGSTELTDMEIINWYIHPCMPVCLPGSSTAKLGGRFLCGTLQRLTQVILVLLSAVIIWRERADEELNQNVGNEAEKSRRNWNAVYREKLVVSLQLLFYISN